MTTTTKQVNVASLRLGAAVVKGTTDTIGHAVLDDSNPPTAGIAVQADGLVVRLAARAVLQRIEIDTADFASSDTAHATLEGIDAKDAAADDLARSTAWKPLLARTKLAGKSPNQFESGLTDAGPVTHVRLGASPGLEVRRLRLWSEFDRDARLALGLRRLNAMDAATATAAFKSCCHASRWVQDMLARRPFARVEDVFAAGEEAADPLDRADWLEAFAGHPRIGESRAKSEQSATAKGWSSQEQAATRSASEQTMAALAEANRAYEARFGYIYIVCATGRSAEEMLAFARERLAHDADAELPVAAGEQRKITRIRLEKLLEP